MDLHLKNRVALVTGGSQGLGKAICLGLAAEGARVAINYRRNPEIADTLVNEIRDVYNVKATAVLGSVTSNSNIIDIFNGAEKELGPVDILINNAAVCPASYVKDMTEEEWNSTLQINLTGTFLTCKEMIRRLLSGGRTGRIVNISSIGAFTGSTSGRVHYDASKGGVISFSISLAREVARDGISVNVVAPGLMITKMTEERIKVRRDSYISRIPFGRFGETSEIADAVVFLSSDRASYITGTTVNVSGGMLMR